MKGSARDRSLRGGATALDSCVRIESDEPPERIREFVRMAEQTCFTLGAWTEAVPATIAAMLKGSPLEPDDAPDSGREADG